MPLELTVLAWMGVVCLGLITALLAGFVGVLIAAALEVRKAARSIGEEVRWVREQRRHFANRARFAGKWLRAFSTAGFGMRARRSGRSASGIFD